MFSESYAYGMWAAVAINAAFIIFFALSFLKPRKRWEWRSMGAFAAFTVALFTEMYGFPLSIYLLISALGSRYPAANPFSHLNGNLWAVFLGGSAFVSMALMALGAIMVFVGLIFMGRGFRQIYKAHGDMVTSGLYARTRHPQYFGLFLITAGMFIQWPTVVSFVIWPILMIMYFRLARREEMEMVKLFGERYISYRQTVPALFPRLTRTPLANAQTGLPLLKL
ncbi:MAG: isoprenylcysteine carboxylmethyltransferase family protein [Chloroflexi bacterium]|nr:isoprenylcysteine carboxylmethyltransferase family protein [Chloroflexota bacterium]